MVRTLAIAVALLSGGCSWVFMDHVGDGYERSEPPNCTTTPGWWILDTVNVAGNLGYAIAIDNAPGVSDDDKTAAWAGGIFGAVVHGLSGVSGAIWADRCKDARGAHRAYLREEAIRREDERARDEEGRRNRSKAVALASEARARPDEPAFYCATSPIDSTAGVCAPTRTECQGARAAIAVDMGPCTPAAAAVCFVVMRDGKRAKQCAPTVGSCNRRRDAAVAADPSLTPWDCTDE